jgi:hypothetical protein
LVREDGVSPLGPVWIGRDTVLNRPVAIQTLSPEAGREAPVRKRFLRAAARAGQVSHPALLQVYDIGDNPPFAVFEYAPRGRLKERLDSGPLPTMDAARIALALARGLEELHQRGGAHGWVTPDTVLIDDEGRPKLAALGVADAARAVAELQSRVVVPAGYRTPETDPLPADADRFALAALTYHMMTGRPPGRPPKPARQVRRHVPLTVERLLAHALDRDPARRPTFDEFERTLGPFARVEPPRVRQPRFVRAEFRWLFPVLLIIAIGAAAVVVGTRVSFETRSAGGGARSPAASRPIAVAAVRDFDPLGNGEENASLASKAIDGDLVTAWRTKQYSTARLGGGKPGVGLVFDLGSAHALRRIRVRSTLPGWEAEWRVAATEGDRPNDYRAVTTFTAGEDATVTLPPGTRARYVLLWITKLAQDEAASNLPYRAFVNEVQFFER